MKLIKNRHAKRGAVALLASATAAALAMLPASPAAAADAACQSYTVGGVSFSICINYVSSVRGQARIVVTSGSYVSGTMYLLGPGDSTDSGCSGRIYAGNACSFSETDGSGIYEAEWYASGGGQYTSGGLDIE